MRLTSIQYWACVAAWIALPTVTAAQVQQQPLTTDRPDFTEASSTVGRGRVQLEAGYTLGYDDTAGTVTRAHSFPETLWRIGVTDDIEFRIGWTYLVERIGAESTDDGAADLYLGSKFYLAEQRGWFPESSIILQFTVPTGADAFSDDEVLYGFNLLYAWELPSGWSLGASTGVNTGRDELPVTALIPALNYDEHVIAHQSVALGIPLTERWSGFIEYFGLYSLGREHNFPENYIDGGFTFLVNDNFQLDWRIGIGLNDQAEDFFTGAGFALRL